MTWSGVIDRIKQELQIEYERYTKYKLGRLVAIGIYLSAFVFIPMLMKVLVPWLNQYVDERWTYVTITFLTVLFVEVGWNAVMPFIYLNKIPFFEQYRHNPDKPWPWEDDPEHWYPLLKRSIGYTCFNMFFTIPMKIIIDSKLSFKVNMDVQQTPALGSMLAQFAIMIFFEDLFFFLFHCLLHQPILYRFHKLHHEYKTTINIAGFHFDLVEVFLTQTVAAFLVLKIGSLFAPIHISFIVIFLALRTNDTNSSHCGYNFSWIPMQVLPFCTYDDFHDFHHSHNVGNYASHFRLWDTVFNTSEAFRKYKAKRALQQKKRSNPQQPKKVK